MLFSLYKLRESENPRERETERSAPKSAGQRVTHHASNSGKYLLLPVSEYLLKLIKSQYATSFDAICVFFSFFFPPQYTTTFGVKWRQFWAGELINWTWTLKIMRIFVGLVGPNNTLYCYNSI